MRKILFVLAILPFLAHAEIPVATPHIADASISAAALHFIDGATELNPLGFVGVLIAKVAFEAAAQGYKEAEDTEMCQAIAVGARSGSWFGAGATIGGLAAGPYGLALGGIGALVLSWDWTKQSAIETCSQPLIIDKDPYSYSGPSCIGWNDARPDFCDEFWSYYK